MSSKDSFYPLPDISIVGGCISIFAGKDGFTRYCVWSL